MKIILSMCGIVAVLLHAGRLQAGAGTPLATNAPACIELRDQYNAPWRLSFPSTNITVLTIADRKGSEQVDDWITALKPRYGGRIDLRGMADLGGAPGFIQGRIRKGFQETRPYPVMMDWSGKVSAQLNCRKDVANILVLGQDGAILGRFFGLATGTNVTNVCAVLEEALSHPRPAAQSPSAGMRGGITTSPLKTP